jgi:hypothetical protein
MPATRLSGRVVKRLTHAEACESNPHYRDDLQIARLTVHYAATGEAVLCPPHVLASYAVLGLHPEKVWPAIEARRKALLGPLLEVLCASPVPKKAAQSVKLWAEKTNRARTVNSRPAMQFGSPRTTSVPMAATPLTAAYPNSEAPSTGKKGEYSYDELLVVIARSGAPEHVRQLTLDAIAVRGRWPKSQGPVTPIISVSITSLQEKAVVWRSTIQRRIQRAKKDKYWREVRTMNSWLNCPKCGAERKSAQCPKCPHKGNGFDPREFRRTFTYAIDVEKFERAPVCRQVRQIRELKARGKSDVAQMPEREEPVRKTAEHQKERTVVNTKISERSRKAAELLMEICGLADLGAIEQIGISITAEAKYRGIEIEDAGKFIADCALRDHREKGVDLTRFYFRDLKWRTNGGQQKTAAQGRAERSQQQIAEALRRFNRDSEVDCSAGPFDGTELKE